MKRAIIAVIFAVIVAGAGCKSPNQTGTGSAGGGTGEAVSRANRQAAGAGAGFDLYLLNLSWSPEFCHSHPTAIECSERATFVLHGLWPENMDGTYPESCSNAPGPSDPAKYKDIYADVGLLRHEWQTHGTCSGLNADAFFEAARSAVREVTIPPTLSGLASQISLPPNEIIHLFTASNPAIPETSLVVSCGNNYLTAVEVCMDKGLHPIACPAIRSCRANTVRIPPPR